ncbi:MAG: GNAT family N-acetyltransferase [Dermatophilaceae bacterium]
MRTIVADGNGGGLHRQLAGNMQRQVGYWVGREYWGRGVATQALARFVDEVSIRPLYAHVAADNVGSIRVLDQCGFRPIACRRRRRQHPRTASRSSSSC